jgi:hypothetical protein
LPYTGRCTRVRLRRLRLQQRYLNCAVRCDYSSHDHTALPRLRLATRSLVVQIAPALLRLCRAFRRVVSPLDFSSVGRIGSRRAFGHCVSQRDYSSSGLHRLYCAYVVHPDAPSRCSTSRQSVALALAVCPVIPLCVVTTCLTAAMEILRLRCASGCLGTSRGSSSTTSPTPHVRVPWHVTRLVKPLIVDYSASRRLVVDYFAFTARLGASACRAARHTARRAARRRLVRLAQARRVTPGFKDKPECKDTCAPGSSYTHASTQ